MELGKVVVEGDVPRRVVNPWRKVRIVEPPETEPEKVVVPDREREKVPA